MPSRILALLEELEISPPNTWPCAVIARVMLRSADGHVEAYYEELLGVFSEDGKPIPYVILEGPQRVDMPYVTSRSQVYKSEFVKLAFPCTKNFVVKIKRYCYHGCRSGIRTVVLMPKEKVEKLRELSLLVRDIREWYEIVENFIIPSEGREEWVARVLKQVIDAIIEEAHADQAKVVSLLCKMLCR